PGMCLQGAEIVGGDFVFDNCTFESLADPSAGSVGVVQVLLQDPIKEPIRLFFNNCRWIVHPDTLYVFRLQFQGCEQDVEVYINGGHVEGGDSLSRFIWARYTSGDKSNYKAIHINGLTG